MPVVSFIFNPLRVPVNCMLGTDLLQVHDPLLDTKPKRIFLKDKLLSKETHNPPKIMYGFPSRLAPYCGRDGLLPFDVLLVGGPILVRKASLPTFSFSSVGEKLLNPLGGRCVGAALEEPFDMVLPDRCREALADLLSEFR